MLAMFSALRKITVCIATIAHTLNTRNRLSLTGNHHILLPTTRSTKIRRATACNTDYRTDQNTVPNVTLTAILIATPNATATATTTATPKRRKNQLDQDMPHRRNKQAEAPSRTPAGTPTGTPTKKNHHRAPTGTPTSAPTQDSADIAINRNADQYANWDTDR